MGFVRKLINVHQDHHVTLYLLILFYLQDEGQSRLVISVLRTPFTDEQYRWEISLLRLQLQRSNYYRIKKRSQCQNVASLGNPWPGGLGNGPCLV